MTERNFTDDCLFWFALIVGTATFLAAIAIAMIGAILQ